MKNNQRTPEEILAEIKLRMVYDSSKSLDQNKKVLEEQNYTSMAGNTAKAAGYATGAGALAGGALGVSAGIPGTAAATGTLAGGGVLGASAGAASSVGIAMGINNLALATAVGGGIITGAIALALTPVVLWYIDKDNAKNKVAKLFKYCKDNKEKIDKVPRGLGDEQIFDLSNNLYDALKGMGTNEEAIYEVFNSLQTISDLAALIETFDSENAAEGGDLLEWLDSDIDMTSEWNQIYRPIRKIVYRFMKDLAKENPPSKDDIEKAKEEKTPGKATGGYKPCTGTYSYGCYAVAIGEVQKCLGVLVDNKFGPKTLAALKAKANMETFTDSDIATICQASNAAATPPTREQGLKMTPLAPRGDGTIQTNQPQPGLQTNTAAIPAQTYTKYQQYFEKDPDAPGRLRYKGPDLSVDDFNSINKFLKDNYGLTFIKKRLPKDYGAKYVWSKL